MAAGETNHEPMLFNYLKFSIRNITRNASVTFINVSGLALDITCALLIFAVINYHLRFDNFHGNRNRIYRFVTEQHRDQVSYAPSVPPAFGKAFRDDYTFGEKVARLCTLPGQLITLEEGTEVRKFKELIAFAEEDFFKIFRFPLAEGSLHHLLRDPNTAVVSERIARKYFGNESPLGKTLRFNNKI